MRFILIDFDRQSFLSKKYFDVAIQLLSSRKPIDSMTSVYLMMFLKQKSSLAEFTEPSESGSKSLSLFLVEAVVVEFARHCESGKKNLLIAALKTPIYGPLSAIHQLIIQSIEE